MKDCVEKMFPIAVSGRVAFTSVDGCSRRSGGGQIPCKALVRGKAWRNALSNRFATTRRGNQSNTCYERELGLPGRACPRQLPARRRRFRR